MKTYELAIVGAGVAGYAAALAAHNLNMDCLWLGERGFGDKVRLAERVRNFPAFSGSGAELAARLEAQRAEEGIDLTEARIDGVYGVKGGYLLTQGETTFSAKAVILAVGVETKGSLRGEREFLGRGLSYCAVCDGALYKGKRIAVVLSSPKYEEEARYLASFASKVVCFCLYPAPTLAGGNISVRTDVPVAVEGRGRVERVVTKAGPLETDGVFLLKNSAPPEALVGGLAVEDGHVAVDRAMRTNLKGLFAAGDVTGRPYQYIKAAGEGLVAAYSAKEYLQESGK